MTESSWVLLTDPEDPRHGSVNAYTNHGCRCDRCKGANARLQRRLRVRRADLEPPESVHGTEGGYSNWRCRCLECGAAHNAAARDRRKAGKQ